MSAPDVVLVDAGGTNIGSVRYALERLGIMAQPSNDAQRIRRATHVLLPGVGAAGPGMQRLRSAKLDSVLPELRQPVLGICLGMQLLFEYSEEGDTACLGVIPGRVERIETAPMRRVPHMGWNRIEILRDDPLLQHLDDAAHAYFVHSYAAAAGSHTLACTNYGSRFAAVVRQRNFYGMQFHPERSAAVGAQLLKNFLAL